MLLLYPRECRDVGLLVTLTCQNMDYKICIIYYSITILIYGGRKRQATVSFHPVQNMITPACVAMSVIGEPDQLLQHIRSVNQANNMA